MVELRCPICGMELKQTNYNNYFCPNHGIVYENPDNNKSDEDPKYIG